MDMEIAEYLRKEPRFASITLGLSAVGTLALLDLLAGPRWSLELLYLLPIAFAAWLAGSRDGFLIAIAGTVAWVFTDPAFRQTLGHPLLPYWAALTKLGFLSLAAWTVPAVKKAWEQERASTSADYLTKAANRRRFLEMLSSEIRRAQRYGSPFTVAHLDVDHLKFVNERFGHDAGDTLLRVVSETLRQKVRSTDLVARIGEDEFGLMLPETQSEAAQIVVRRLQRHLLDAAQKNEWPVSFSFGMGTFLRPLPTAEETLKKVETLLASAKEEGGNRVRHDVVDSAPQGSSKSPEPS